MRNEIEKLIHSQIKVDLKSENIDATLISEYIYDLAVVFIVAKYYNSNSSKGLHTFLKNTFSIQELINEYPLIKETYKILISQIKLFQEEDTRDTTQLLGDPHPNFTTKFSRGEYVFSHLPFQNLDYLFHQTSKILKDNTLIELFPEYYQEKRGIYKRMLIPKENRFNTKKEISNYYLNFGKGLTTLLLLRSIDNYYENVLIGKSLPIFFDHECIFTNQIRGEADKPYGYEYTGLINPIDKEFDTSSLTGAKSEIKTLLKPYIDGSDLYPKIKWIKSVYSNGSHIPKYKDNHIKISDFTEDLEKGIRLSTKLLLNNITEIKRMVSQTYIRPRVLLRSSAFYKTLLVGYAYEYLQFQTEMSEYFKQKLIESVPILEDIEVDKTLLEYEVRSLKSGLIPIFYQDIHTTDIFDAYGNKVTKFKTSSEKIWLQHLDNFPQAVNSALERVDTIE